MYGDIHFRKWSWDLCREVIKDKRFVESTGIIFMELGSNCQNKINRFLAKDKLDTELLLDVFREYQIDGWDERGKFEFIVDIWKINKNLPLKKRIKIILVDTPRPFNTINSQEELRANRTTEDERNLYMAQTIENYLRHDDRNTFFTVGTAHICKSLKSAGAILSGKLNKNETYSIFTHSPRMDNRIDIPERIRHGIFDYAFYEIGNKPMAFELIDSPFGKEPFDGFYNEGINSFQDNYDGYVFLGPLDEEPEGEILFDLYSDKFITELNRRYSWYNSNLKDWWELEDSDKKSVLEYLIKNLPEKRWEDIIKPLQNGKMTE